MARSPILQNIPCTLVTGFLGAGKTTVINQLLSTKPDNQRWALLINEFGRIGIDGALLTSAQNLKDSNIAKDSNNTNLADKGIAISEVSGGCICCTSQLPLQVALTRLLSDHRPQRLIIEPTGLAHPHELLRQLTAPHWQTALSMQAVIAVLSGIQWQQEKYRTHEGFQAHIRAADVVVINRYEQLSKTCQQELQAWIVGLNSHVQMVWATPKCQKATDPSDFIEFSDTYLVELRAQLGKLSHTISQQRTNNANPSRTNLTAPTRLDPNTSKISDVKGNLEANNELPYRYHDEQKGVLLTGWRLPPDWIFNADGLHQWLLQLPDWQRIKGVVHTSNGWLQINFTADSLTMNTASAQIDSRLEVILFSQDTSDKGTQRTNWVRWDSELMALIL